METVYKKNNYEVRKIDDMYYPIEIIAGSAHGIGQDARGELTYAGNAGNESVIISVAAPRTALIAAIAVIRRAVQNSDEE